MKPLISVIVPVYKVEPYLHKCVDSILNQTYQNLEVILVDDGSPDNCGAICDAYAEQDSRVKVIHKENGGLSSARNAGLEIASGEYISFVDSDDWLDTKLYSCCLDAMPFDMAIFGITYVYEGAQDSQIVPACEKPQSICWGKDDQLFLDLVRRSLFGYMCNKIYRRNIIQRIRFPDILLREDLVTNIELLKRTEDIVLINCSGYYYFQRSDSSLHGKYSGNVPDIEMISRKLIASDNKLSRKTNIAISNLLVRCYLNDALYRYVFKNSALSDRERLCVIEKIFSDKEIVNTLRFSVSDGKLAMLLFFCAKLRCSRLFFSIMKRKWYV